MTKKLFDAEEAKSKATQRPGMKRPTGTAPEKPVKARRRRTPAKKRARKDKSDGKDA